MGGRWFESDKHGFDARKNLMEAYEKPVVAIESFEKIDVDFGIVEGEVDVALVLGSMKSSGDVSNRGCKWKSKGHYEDPIGT